MGYFEVLFGNEWELTKSPAGAHQWTPKGGVADVPDAHDANVKHKPMMLTSDLALRTDPEYTKISRHFYENPEEFADAYARAWFKLTHRDMGPKSRYLGEEVPSEDLIWQDPLPASKGPLAAADIEALKAAIKASGLSQSDMIETAWASASTFRGSDYRGGANGARIRLAPQKDWAVNKPAQLANVLAKLEQIQTESATDVSLADLIVLAGNVGVELAAKAAGHDITAPFTSGRVDASQEQTDVESFAVLEPQVDGFRNYEQAEFTIEAEKLLIDRAQLLTLSAPEMTALVGGMRALGISADGKSGLFGDRIGQLTNDFFKHLLDMSVEWSANDQSERVFTAKDRKSGAEKMTASRVDLVFGSNSQLRAISEAYAQDDSGTVFVDMFVKTWAKVMNLDLV